MESEDDIISKIVQELRRASDKYPPMRSMHELWGILDEEVAEFKDAVRSNDREHALNELVHVAAMAMRGMRDLGEQPTTQAFKLNKFSIERH